MSACSLAPRERWAAQHRGEVAAHKPARSASRCTRQQKRWPEIMTFAITEHIARSPRHTSFYLACGAPQASAIVFLHGWPELSISWRHQLPVFAGLGFRAVAPDMRGYGRSSSYGHYEDYALEEVVADMIELLDRLGAEKAIWVGHDSGSPVVWSIAQHHPHRCHGIASLCVPYMPAGFTVE